MYHMYIFWLGFWCFIHFESIYEMKEEPLALSGLSVVVWKTCFAQRVNPKSFSYMHSLLSLSFSSTQKPSQRYLSSSPLSVSTRTLRSKHTCIRKLTLSQSSLYFVALEKSLVFFLPGFWRQANTWQRVKEKERERAQQAKPTAKAMENSTHTLNCVQGDLFKG